MASQTDQFFFNRYELKGMDGPLGVLQLLKELTDPGSVFR